MLKKFLGLTLLVTVCVVLSGLLGSKAFATQVDECDETFVYTKSSDFSDSRVNINYENSDEQIDVSAGTGYVVTKVELDVEDDGHGGFWTYATGPVNNFNPSGGDIENAKVTVKKVCPKVNICHSGNGTNYTSVEVDKDAWDEHESAHSDHQYDFLITENNPCPPVDVCLNIEGPQGVVPRGYYAEQGNCYPKVGVCTDKNASNYDEDFNEVTEYEDNESCEYGTHRWCRRICNDVYVLDQIVEVCQNESYEAIAVPDNEENPAGKPWETGMDRYCQFPPPPPPPPAGGSGVSDGKAPPALPPACADGNTLLVPTNFHIIRNGSSAELKWIPTAGGQVNIYWKIVGTGNWQHALGDQLNDGYVVINDLKPELGYTFGVQQKNGCGGGEVLTAVVEDPPANGVMFRFSYWQWN